MFRINEYCIEGEVWKSIPGYDNLYEASSLGRIRSVDGKKTYTERHGVRTWKGKILKNKTKTMRKEGYKVTLWKNGESFDWLVARLVCMTFYGEVDHNKPVKDKLTVNHKDGDRSNNKVENLEWLSLKENIQHAFKTGLYDNCKKQIIIDLNNGFSKRFDSLSEASIYIGRGKKYISGCIKNNRIPKWSDGKEVKMFKVF